MKTLILLSMIAFSFSAMAISDKIEEECREAAVEKLQLKAEAWGANLDENSISKLDEEKRVLTGSILVWFKADAYRIKDNSRIFVTASMEKQILPLKKPCE